MKRNKNEALNKGTFRAPLRCGFTLVELLVVVLIIGVLAAIALPMYQKAVLKSRFSAMMPIAKAMAESNEIYYLDHGRYSENPEELTIQGKNTVEEAYADGTTILMYSNEEDLSFVRTENANIPNARYVVYQKHSKNFADTTWCEAGDERAEAMCVALGGVIPDGVSGNSGMDADWTAYLLSGDAKAGDSFAEAGTNSGTDTPAVTCNEADKPADISPTGTNPATGKATCLNGQWKYTWTGGRVYDTDYDSLTIVCDGVSAYTCAGAEFKGKNNQCYGHAENGCVGATFSGEMSRCVGWVANGCAGTTSQAGSYCYAYKSGGCDGAKYGEDPTGQRTGIGSCMNAMGYCPNGAPIKGDWNSTNGSYDYTWKGGYCDPNAMASGKCPAGTHSADSNGTLDGQCWDGSGNRIACE